MKSYENYETTRFSPRNKQRRISININQNYYYIINFQEGRIYKQNHSKITKFQATKWLNYK